MSQEPNYTAYAKEFLDRLRERHPEWEPHRTSDDSDLPDYQLFVFACPNPAVTDPLELEVDGDEVTVYWPAGHHQHFPFGLGWNPDEAIDLAESIMAERIVVVIYGRAAQWEWAGSTAFSVEYRPDPALMNFPFEMRSWLGNYDEERSR